MRDGRSVTAGLLVLIAAGPLAACGTPSADLFLVDRTGSIPGAKLNMLVGDGGTIRCNGVTGRPLDSKELIEARTLTRDLNELGPLVLKARPASSLSYTVTVEAGEIRFADNSAGRAAPLDRLALFVRRTAKGKCGLAR